MGGLSFYFRRRPGNINRVGQGIAQFLPAGESSLQRTYSRDPQFLQLLCHTGTSGFIGSSAVEDDLLIFGKDIGVAGNFTRQDANGPGQSARIGDRIQRMTQI